MARAAPVFPGRAARRHRPTSLPASKGDDAGGVRLIRETVDSPQETGLRLWALRRGLPEPEVHPQVFCPLLGRVVEPDLGYRRARLALEYEGGHHFESKEQWTRDINRDEGLHAAGWTVLRVTSRTDRRQLEAKIRAHLERE